MLAVKLAVPLVAAVIANVLLHGKITACDLRVATSVFAVTAAWDVVLNYISRGALPIPYLSDMDWIKKIKPYFDDVGVAEAAVVAGAVGVGVLPFIGWWSPGSDKLALPKMMAWVFVVSALYGLPMRIVAWLPELNAHYYEQNPFITTLILDGLSGVIVLLTLTGIRLAVCTGGCR